MRGSQLSPCPLSFWNGSAEAKGRGYHCPVHAGFQMEAHSPPCHCRHQGLAPVRPLIPCFCSINSFPDIFFFLIKILI